MVEFLCILHWYLNLVLDLFFYSYMSFSICISDYYPNEHQLPPAPPTPLEQYNDIGFIPSVFENPEYFEGDIDKKTLENNMINKKMKPKIAPKPRKLSDYYNEPDKLERERRPLLVSDPNTSNCSNSETTI